MGKHELYYNVRLLILLFSLSEVIDFHKQANYEETKHLHIKILQHIFLIKSQHRLK